MTRCGRCADWGARDLGRNLLFLLFPYFFFLRMHFDCVHAEHGGAAYLACQLASFAFTPQRTSLAGRAPCLFEATRMCIRNKNVSRHGARVFYGRQERLSTHNAANLWRACLQAFISKTTTVGPKQKKYHSSIHTGEERKRLV